MTITLPIPPYVLSPNGRSAHWRVRHRATKTARAKAKLETLLSLGGADSPVPVGYSLRYFWRSTHRDDDNAIASAKAYMDGICEALRMDDRKLRFRALIHEHDTKKPRLEIILHLDP